MNNSVRNTYLDEACRNGDPKAQLQVYKLYFRQMFNLSLKLVRNAETADEIVKESFFAAFDKINEYQGKTDFITWLEKIVQERSAETWRKNNVTFRGLVTDRALR